MHSTDNLLVRGAGDNPWFQGGEIVAGARLLGLRITRSASLGRPETPQTLEVWSGFTEADRQTHETFIRTKVHCPEVDGLLTLEPIESEVIVRRPGIYRGAEGRPAVRIESVKADGTCFGYTQKPDRRGKCKDDLIVWLYVNGLDMGHPAQQRITCPEEG